MKYLFISISSLILSITALSAELKVATWNIKLFFDHDSSDNPSSTAQSFEAPSEEEWNWRVNQVAKVIATLEPTVIGLQEIEDLGATSAISDALKNNHGLDYDISFVQGKDTYTEQDVVFLIKKGIQFTGTRYHFSHRGVEHYKNLSKHQRLSFKFGGEQFIIVVAHLSTTPHDRMRQARTLREWVEQDLNSGNLIVMGDLNSKYFPADVTGTTDLGVILGLETPSASDDLIDYSGSIPRHFQKTWQGKSPLDRIMLSQTLTDTSGFTARGIFNHRNLVVRGSNKNGKDCKWTIPQSERDLSDHFPLMATFTSSIPPQPPHAASLLHSPQPTPQTFSTIFNLKSGSTSSKKRLRLQRHELPEKDSSVQFDANNKWTVISITWRYDGSGLKEIFIDCEKSEGE